MNLTRYDAAYITVTTLFIIIVGFFQLRIDTSPRSVDLLKSYDWTHMAGANLSDDGLVIDPINRKIVNQDGSGGQQNAPINLDGFIEQNNGQFSLELTAQKLVEGSSLRIYGGLPVIYDEWRFEPASLAATYSNDHIKLTYFDGSKSSAISSIDCPLSGQNSAKLIAKNGVISIDKGCSISVPELYKSDKLYFGLYGVNQAWVAKSLIITGRDIKTHAVQDKVYSGRRSGLKYFVGNDHVKVGAAVSINPIVVDKQYRDLAINEFNSWTTENDLKAQFVHPQPDIYSFQEADNLVKIAQKNNITVHGHALVFGEANPRWMQDASPDKRHAIMYEHISRVVGHYKGQIKSWDVINEPLSDNDDDYEQNRVGYKNNIWYQAMGPEYIADALRAAHMADPNAKLYINDYGLEANGERWSAMLKLVTELKKAGVPLDGVGFQSHVYEHGDDIDQITLSKHFEQLAAVGLSGRISEMDVYGDSQSEQASQYAEVLKACLSAPNCASYTTWGITDQYGSTTEINSYPQEYGDALIWDVQMRPKSAYKEIRKILSREYIY